MNYSTKVVKVENGFLIEIDSEEVGKATTVFEEPETPYEDAERQAFCDMVWYLAEYFGLSFDKDKNNNLEINFNKEGDDYEPLPEK